MTKRKHDYEIVREVLATNGLQGKWKDLAELYTIVSGIPISGTTLLNIARKRPDLLPEGHVVSTRPDLRKYDYSLLDEIVIAHPEILEELGSVLAFVYYMKKGTRIPLQTVHDYKLSSRKRLGLINGKKEQATSGPDSGAGDPEPPNPPNDRHQGSTTGPACPTGW